MLTTILTLALVATNPALPKESPKQVSMNQPMLHKRTTVYDLTSKKRK